MHTIFKVLTFGCNDEGALGRVTDGLEDAEFKAAEVELPGKVIQISAGDSHTAALLEDGRVFAWGTFRVNNWYIYKKKILILFIEIGFSWEHGYNFERQ